MTDQGNTDSSSAEEKTSELLKTTERVFGEVMAGYPDPTIRMFQAAIQALAKRTLNRIMQFYEVDALSALPIETAESIVLLLVMHLNSALPLDYPFLCAIIKPDSGGSFLGVVARSKIPGTHESIKSAQIPIINLSSDQKVTASTTLKNLRVTDVIRPNYDHSLDRMLESE